MSNHDQTPGNSNSSTPEQVPHSGVHGYELPVDEFDNTTLAEAHEQGLLVTPDTAARLADTPQPETETTTEPPLQVSDRRNTTEKLPLLQRTSVRIGGAVLGVATLLGVGVGVAAQGGESTPERSPDTTNSAAPNPGTENPGIAEEPTVEVPVAPETEVVAANNFTKDEFDSFLSVCRTIVTDDPGFNFSDAIYPSILDSFQQIPQDRLDQFVRPTIQSLANGAEAFQVDGDSNNIVTAKSMCGTILYQEAGKYMNY